MSEKKTYTQEQLESIASYDLVSWAVNFGGWFWWGNNEQLGNTKKEFVSCYNGWSGITDFTRNQIINDMLNYQERRKLEIDL